MKKVSPPRDIKKSFKYLMKELIRKKIEAKKAEIALRKLLNRLY